jgi:hypothetical protein
VKQFFSPKVDAKDGAYTRSLKILTSDFHFRIALLLPANYLQRKETTCKGCHETERSEMRAPSFLTYSDLDYLPKMIDIKVSTNADFSFCSDENAYWRMGRGLLLSVNATGSFIGARRAVQAWELWCAESDFCL